jgi:LPXTG-motif cell wall-anchored protein
MSHMAKKTGMSGSTLWIVTIVLLVLGAWMYFKR